MAEAGKVVVLEVSRPPCKPNEVLVRTAYSVISTGTESWTISATDPISAGDLLEDRSRLGKAISLASEVVRKEGLGGLADYTRAVRKPRVALGYSLSGEVIEVGRLVSDVTIGDFVACAGEGKACHAEFVAVPRNLLVKIPKGTDHKSSAFVALGAIALHAFRRGETQIGETATVIGVGLVGNLLVQIARAAGCRVIAVDLQEERLDLAKESGAEVTLLSSDEKLLDHVQHFTKGQGSDVVFVCASTSSSEPVNVAAQLVKDRGAVVVVGRVGMEFDRKPYYQKELEVRMTRSLGPGRYDQAYEEKGMDYPIGYARWTLNRNMESFIELVAKNEVKLDGLIEASYPVERAAEAYERLKTSRRVAVLLEYPLAPVSKDVPSSIPLFSPSKTERVNVALIGPGNFARETLLPILRTNRHFALRWVVSSNPLNALQTAERYHFERYGTVFEDALGDQAVGVVVISTPNNLHYRMAVEAAKAGKVAFVEKPLCTKEEELREFQQLDPQVQSKIVVGFNRRYSSHILRIKNILATLDGPFLLNYRVNADLVPQSKWSQDPEIGGGRVIHECCHFFDLFGFILDSKSVSATVSAAEVTGSTTVSRDSFSATLKYSNGSVATLVYSSLGNRYAGRERMEIFGQRTVITLDDFRQLTCYSGKKPATYRTSVQDKGHKSEFEELARAARGEKNHLIGAAEIITAMQDTFLIDRLLRREVPSSESGRPSA